MIHHLGQDFTTKIKLNLLPKISVSKGLFTVTISYTTMYPNDMGMQVSNHTSYLTSHDNLDVIFGRDVYHIEVNIHRDINYQSGGPVYINYQMRLDNLILLNLASKFLKFEPLDS